MRFLFCIVFSTLFSSLFAQIINIEKARIRSKDSIGWSGNLNGGFSLNKNTKLLFSLNSAAQVQYKNRKNLYLLLGKLEFTKADQEAFVNNTFLHFRYNYKINKWLRWEAFAQIQNNVITRIKFRGLIGTGPRHKVWDKEKFSLYAASLYMFEYDEENTATNQILYLQEHRQSSYLSLTWKPNANFECQSTTYYQPKWGYFEDFRLLCDVNLKFKVATHLSYSTVFNGLYDAFPAVNIPKTIYSFSNRLSYEF